MHLSRDDDDENDDDASLLMQLQETPLGQSKKWPREHIPVHYTKESKGLNWN